MTAVLPSGYPTELTEQAFLTDGTALLFRAILPEDAARLERLHHRLSPQSLYLRFFSPVARVTPAMIAYLVTVDYVDRLAIVALIDDDIVGVARYDRLSAIAPPALKVDPREAEAAVIVEDAWQGHGIGTRLLWRLSAAARARGIDVFTATILGSNRRMIGLLSELGEVISQEMSGGEYTVKLRLPPAGSPAAPADRA